MANALFKVPTPHNEPILQYAPGSPERARLKEELDRQYNQTLDIPLIIGGKEIRTGKTLDVVCPHEHAHKLAHCHQAGEKEVKMAIETAMEAKVLWESLPWEERAALSLKAADLITHKYRYILNAATMLNQSKNPFQAEIDSACEIADFLRYNPSFLEEIYSQQPLSSNGTWNRVEYRPLEGFIFAITPFNFTSIAGNLTTSPALMGNTVIWKPASTALLSGYYLMKLFQEAGFPDGVINFVPGSGSTLSGVLLKSPHLGGIHFTGSTKTFNSIWRTVAENLDNNNSYPRLVGETGGKDFVFVHPSADPQEVAVALVRGSFEYQGQKCSAASRVYLPGSLASTVFSAMEAMVADIKTRTGDPRDFHNFFNAVIDEKSFDATMAYIDHASKSPDAEIVIGGKGDKSVGYFVEPTVIRAKTPDYLTMREEIFAPVLTAYIYPDGEYEKTLEICDKTSPYGLTGSIIAKDRVAVHKAYEKLRHSAGNFYINDKPTGAVVGQQPFGGARQSGTNDKAGSFLNLIRWTSPRTIKETFVSPTDYGYPFMK